MNLTDSVSQWAALQGIGKKPRTRDYHQEVIGYLLAHWPDDPLADVAGVTDQVLTDFVLRVAPLSASRFNALVCVLRATVPAAKKLKRRPLRLKDRPLLSQLEFSRLLEELDKRPRSHAGLVIRFLAHTGLRINEARQVRWSDVLADRIVIPGATTKNGHPRTIPFVNGIAATLDELRKLGDGVRVLPQDEAKRSLATACDRAGVPKLTHHDFRHLFATRCIQSGVDIPTVARWLGHRDGGALLAKTYYHLADEHSLAMAARVRL